jgi:hypothetical protein
LGIKYPTITPLLFIYVRGSTKVALEPEGSRTVADR